MTAVFLETSALLRMLFGEEGGGEVAKRLQGAERAVASRLIRVECERALIRISLDRPESHRQVLALERELKRLWPKIDFIEVSRDVCDLAGRLAPKSRLRTLDAIHLATWFRARELDPGMEILTFDERIRQEI